MPSVSAKQAHMMQAVAHSPEFARKVGIKQSVGRDFAAADAGKKFAQGGAVQDDDSWLWGANDSADALDSPQAMADGGIVKPRPKTFKVRGETYAAEPLKPVEDAYRQFLGRPPPIRDAYPAFDEERARKIAGAYDQLPMISADPRTRRAYDAMIEETMGQYKALKGSGYEFPFMKPDEAYPYAASPAEGYLDLKRNGRLTIYPTEAGFGTLNDANEQHPLLRRVGPIENLPDATANDVFRIVHDMYGHFGPGNPFFRHQGEERAWQNHADMYSPEALPAMTTETRGQNSWLNFGPYGERNRNANQADTVYGDQKAALLPDFAMERGAAPTVDDLSVRRFTKNFDLDRILAIARSMSNPVTAPRQVGGDNVVPIKPRDENYKDGGRVTPRRIEFRDDFDTMFGGQSRQAGDLVRAHTEKTGKEGAIIGNEFFHTPLIRGARTSVDLDAGKLPMSRFSEDMERQQMPYFSVHAHPLLNAGPHMLDMKEAARVMSSPRPALGGPFFPSAADLRTARPNHTMMIESAGLPDNRLAVEGGNLADYADARKLLGHINENPVTPGLMSGMHEWNKANKLWAIDDTPIDMLINDALAQRGVPMAIDKRAGSGLGYGSDRVPFEDMLPDFKKFIQSRGDYPYAEGGRA